MTKINKILFTFLLLFFKSNQLPNGKVINTCGKLGYEQPTEAKDCIENQEYCCYVKLKNTENPNEEIKFCVSSPSDIDKDDVASEIERYTKYEILELSCNNSQIIKNSLMILLILFFILF